ncbi:hypothetical protein P9112_011859 [Eukaryota sp. TZLM1-RC]
MENNKLKRDSLLNQVNRCLIQFNEDERYVMNCPIATVSEDALNNKFPNLVLFLTNRALLLLTDDYSIIWERSILEVDSFSPLDEDPLSANLHVRVPFIEKNNSLSEVRLSTKRRRGVKYAVEPSKKLLISNTALVHIFCSGFAILKFGFKFKFEEDKLDILHLIPVLVRDYWQQVFEKEFIPAPLMFYSLFYVSIPTGKHANKPRILVITSHQLINFRVKAVLVEVDCMKWSIDGKDLTQLDIDRNKILAKVNCCAKVHYFRFTSVDHLNQFSFEIRLLYNRCHSDTNLKFIEN